MDLVDWNTLQVKLYNEYGINTKDMELINRISNKLKHFKTHELNLSTLNACKNIVEVELGI